MKFVIVIAASVASAGLVLPTVSQGQTREVSEQEAPAAAASVTKLNA